MRYQVGSLEFDPVSGDLQVGAGHQRLAPQPAAALRLLIEHDGAMVPRSEFTATIWPGEEFGVSDRLTYCLHQLRRTLAELGLPDAIETVPRRGYRFRGPESAGISRPGPLSSDPMETVEGPVTSFRSTTPLRRLALAAGIAVMVLAGLALGDRQGSTTLEGAVTPASSTVTAHASRHAARHGAQHAVP